MCERKAIKGSCLSMILAFPLALTFLVGFFLFFVFVVVVILGMCLGCFRWGIYLIWTYMHFHPVLVLLLFNYWFTLSHPLKSYTMCCLAYSNLQLKQCWGYLPYFPHKYIYTVVEVLWSTLIVMHWTHCTEKHITPQKSSCGIIQENYNSVARC